MADEAAELQARIAAISGRIDQHKQHHQPFSAHSSYPPRHHHPSYPPQPPRRGWSAYHRGGRAGYQAPHKNRTLVLNGNQRPASDVPVTSSSGQTPAPTPTAASPAFVSSRAPGKSELMSKDVYEREQKKKLENRGVTKRQKVNREERSRLVQHVAKRAAQGDREMVVEGIRFSLRGDGSKLLRIPDMVTAPLESPRKIKIADVDFFRTKHGNLVRANAVKDLNRVNHRRQTPQCENFTKNGNCPFGPSCRFSHDPEKVAICKTFLRNGSCALGGNCNMSHELTYHRVSACQHFLRGNCTNDACRYPHISVPPAAPVCPPFALTGYCAKGPDCEKRHVAECPNYSNTGFCANREKGLCCLPHPDHASILRKAAARQSKMASEDDSDMTSDGEQEDEEGPDDIDSDEADDVMMGEEEDERSRELSQQNDYVAFS